MTEDTPSIIPHRTLRWTISIVATATLLAAIFLLDQFLISYRERLILEKIEFHKTNKSSAQDIASDEILSFYINKENRQSLRHLKRLSNCEAKIKTLNDADEIKKKLLQCDQTRERLLAIAIPRDESTGSIYSFMRPLLEQTF